MRAEVWVSASKAGAQKIQGPMGDHRLILGQTPRIAVNELQECGGRETTLGPSRASGPPERHQGPRRQGYPTSHGASGPVTCIAYFVRSVTIRPFPESP